MGRELQKKKSRSSVAKVKAKTKSKKKLLQNPIIAANWNQKETLSQNYRRIGLVSKLNHATGGVEKNVKTLEEVAQGGSGPGPTPANLDISSKLPKMLNVTEMRIERDAETGAILRVLDDKEENPLNDRLNDIEDSEGEDWEGFVNEHGVIDGAAPKSDGRTDVVRQLEARAAQGVKKAPRKQSDREEQWIEALIDKYGDDYAKMARDMKLNPMQQSIGDLKKRVKKYRASH